MLALALAFAALPILPILHGSVHAQGDVHAPASSISDAQAKELFQSVDTILRFDAQDTGLAVRETVKRKLLTREQVVTILKQKMEGDKDTARIERSTIVLEKFGLLPQHFTLRPFLLKLLSEQVAGFYDSKTKTVNLLNWIDADTQKPVLAHELTHALQDQYQTAHGITLDRWENAGPDSTPRNVAEDREHLRFDETGTAREAALEGQAMVAYYDYALEGRGQTLRTLPDISPGALSDATGKDSGKDSESPVLDSAPMVLRESLLFPYQEGLMFEQRLLKDRGTAAAFASVLSKPPGTSYEILHPHFYEQAGIPPLLSMPDLHPLLDGEWAPYDVGVMGALDVRMLAEALAGKGAGADAALSWDGGLYYAAQARTATTDSAKNDTASIALVYLSRWKTADAAASFTSLYRASLAKRYKHLEAGAGASANANKGGVQMTEEGPVLARQQGRYVYISHSLPVPLAESVMSAMLAAQSPTASAALAPPQPELTAPLRHMLAQAGMMRAATPRLQLNSMHKKYKYKK